MAPRPCIHCGRLVANGSRCPACQAARWADQGQRRAPRPWYDSAWRKLSKQARAAQPWCSRCGSPDQLQVDHVTPRSLAGGVRVLCPSCHALVGSRTPGGVKSW